MLRRIFSHRSLIVIILTISLSCEDFEDGLGDSSGDESLDGRGITAVATYQAENRTGTSGCSQKNNHTGFTGSGFIDFGGNGTWIEWNNVDVSVAGEYELTFRYANGSAGNRQGAAIINGRNIGNVSFARSGAWTSWKTESRKVQLRQGKNTVRVMANTGSGGPNLDKMDISISDLCPNDPQKIEPGACGCGVPEGSCGGTSLCAEAAEHKSASLSCQSGKKINSISFASYGLPLGSCNTSFGLGSCHATSSKSKVEAACLNKTSCSVTASNSVFGDPCSGKAKKIAILYTCGGGNVDNCPDDPKKTEPGECGCGVPEGTCGECTDTMRGNDKILTGEHICSQNGTYQFGLTSAGKLALWSGSGTVWSDGTFGSNVHLKMQRDGNLVVYNPTKALWSSRTHGNSGAVLKLENDGRVVIRLGTKVLWQKGGSGPVDNCPGDPNKTEPGQCGCGVPEGTCGGGKITHVGTTEIWDADGQNMAIARPSGSRSGDLLVLILHRTDDDLPLYVNGWTRVAECYKSDNPQECRIEKGCAEWHNDDFCKYFGTDRWRNNRGQMVRYEGHDLAQSVFYKKAGSSEPSKYTFNLNRDSSGHPGWAILTALRGAATINPVRDWAYKGCDGSADSVFPSVYGHNGDMVLLSQSFDDKIAQSKFGAPSGKSSFGYVSNSDEAGFLFGGILTSTGETGAMKTQGDGGPACKDVLVSLTIKPQ